MTNNKLTDERVPDERLEQFADIAIRRGFFDATTGEVEAMVSELRQRRAADRNYFMYGIAEPDGCAYLDELCVSRDISVLQSIADELNLNEGTDGYRVVALYTALPLTDDERRELQEYRKAAPVEINDEMVFVFCRALSDDAVGADEVEDIKTGLRAAFANITTPQPAPAVEAVPVVPPEADAHSARMAVGFNKHAQSGFIDGWNACRAAMLNHSGGLADKGGADGTLTNEVAIPVTKIQPVADLYGITPSTGCETSFTFDAVEAADFIAGGCSVQEYVELERYQQACAGNSPVIPDGYALVPIEPTEDMIINGFESEPDESFSKPEVWEAYNGISGCKQAAHRVRLCWTAMIAAAPQQEVK